MAGSRCSDPTSAVIPTSISCSIANSRALSVLQNGNDRLLVDLGLGRYASAFQPHC